jgi:hypothetical protein
VAAGRRGTDAPARARLNLPAIEQTLRHLQAELAPEGSLRVPRDPFDDRVIANLMAGYALVDTLVADEIDIFAMGQLKHILELNALVLCGTDAARRAAYARHFDATERHFYELRDGGIRDVVEWHAAHRNDPARDRAAGLYVRLLCHPQLFIEGNHRTGALIMSYVMLQGGEPPFVVSANNAAEYFEVSSALRSTDRNGPAALLRLPAIRQRLLMVLTRHAESRYLLGGSSRPSS